MFYMAEGINDLRSCMISACVDVKKIITVLILLIIPRKNKAFYLKILQIVSLVMSFVAASGLNQPQDKMQCFLMTDRKSVV